MPDKRFEIERYELRESPVYFFRVNRRQFIGSIGAGLLIAAAPGAQAQRGSGEPPLEGRLHIGEDGRITILTGKIEEGQGPRTELAMAAAEELRVPLSRVDVHMADTDTSPNDWITAGSRTTPGTVPTVRCAAAAARELLITAAAAKWNVQRADVFIKDGKAVPVNGSQTFTYKELARSPELTKAYTQPLPTTPALTPAKEWSILGRPHVRVNGAEIVTGSHRYPSDIQRPGMLYGSVMRPSSFGASLVSVDLDAAKPVGDVIPVRDGDFAGCAAPTSYTARKGVQALAATAKWNEKKQQPSNDTLFDYLRGHAQTGGNGGRGGPQVKGDVTKALASSKRRLKASYRTAYIQHGPMEPRAAVAEWQDGKLTVWTGTSNPFGVRDQLAEAFRIPAQLIRVIVPDMGGGFGGKHTGEVAIEAARLAREAKRPVSLRWTRAEEFTWAYSRPAALIDIEAGLDANNGIEAWDFTNINSGAAAIDIPYRCANSRIRFMPSDSPLRQGSYRALASTANNFAREAFIDELADAVGADPLEFRLANLDNDRVRAVLMAATNKFGWKERRKESRPNRGIGLACGTEKNSVVAACVDVEVDRNTRVPRLVEICEAFECGAVLNPANLRSQVEGCILMGLGAVLREEMQFADGRIKNGRFSAYRVPRFHDVPKMDILLVDKKDAEPVGAGETPIIAVAPAMANAVFAVTKQRVRSLPFRLRPTAS